jgi:hypothetical protein
MTDLTAHDRQSEAGCGAHDCAGLRLQRPLCCHGLRAPEALRRFSVGAGLPGLAKCCGTGRPGYFVAFSQHALHNLVAALGQDSFLPTTWNMTLASVIAAQSRGHAAL